MPATFTGWQSGWGLSEANALLMQVDLCLVFFDPLLRTSEKMPLTGGAVMEGVSV